MNPWDRLDTRSLVEPIPWGEVARHDRSLWVRLGIGLGLTVLAIGLFVGGVALATRSSAATGGVFAAAVLAVIIGPSLIATVPAAGTVHRIRLLARRNGLGFAPRATSVPRYPGMIFRPPGVPVITRQLWQNTPTERWEVADATTIVGSGKSSRSYAHAYLQFTLPTAVPHLVVDARRNDRIGGGSNLPFDFSNASPVPLPWGVEGRAWIAPGAEQAAAALLTPDVLAALAALARWDLELVDDRLFLYRNGRMPWRDPAELRAVFAVAAAVASRVASLAYVDDGSRLLATGAGGRMSGTTREPKSAWWVGLLWVVGIFVAIPVLAVVVATIGFVVSALF
jgi:hypothetical protein